MAIAGTGVSLEKDTGSGTYESLGDVININGPGMSRSTIETTHLNTAGGYQTFITGLRNPGTVTFSINFDRTAYDDLKADFENDNSQSYRIQFDDADNTQIDFDGWVTELPLTIPTNDRVTMDVTLQINGQPTVASGT